MPVPPAKLIPKLVVLTVVLGWAAGCAPLMLPMLPSGSSVGEDAFRRASKEFSCPTDKINLVQRDDIVSGLFDLEACGQRARYNCRQNECFREPEPARWDPDPVLCRTPDAIKGKPVKCVRPYTYQAPTD
jgi:hypothetical protein